MRASCKPIRRAGQRGRPRRPLSPFSMAMVEANRQIPPMWESRSVNRKGVRAGIVRRQPRCWFSDTKLC
jgi:hypothetical protein